MRNLKWQYFLFLIGIFLPTIVGCQTASSNNHPTPTSSFNRRTENVEALRPLLIKPDDLGIAEEYYEEITEELLDRDPSPSDLVSTQIYLNLQTRRGNRKHGAYQDVLVYSDKEQAIQAFEFKRNRFGRRLRELDNFNPQLSNVLAGCRPRHDYEMCQLMVQYGQYLVLANMIVGDTSGEISFTMDDWEKFVSVIQDRIVEQVELEEQ